MNLVELVDRVIDIGPYDQPPTPDIDNETPPPREKDDTKGSTTIKPKLLKEKEFEEEHQPREEEEDTEDNTTIKSKLLEVEEFEEENEPREEGNFEEQWPGDQDLEETTLDQGSGEITIEGPDMEGILAAKEEPKPEVAYWKRERYERMRRGTFPFDAPRQ